jgi:hypothetical protein
MLGAIAEEAEPACEAAGIVTAFYLSSMPREPLERNGIDPAEVAPAVEAFKLGDVRRSSAAGRRAFNRASGRAVVLSPALSACARPWSSRA